MKPRYSVLFQTDHIGMLFPCELNAFKTAWGPHDFKIVLYGEQCIDEDYVSRAGWYKLLLVLTGYGRQVLSDNTVRIWILSSGNCFVTVDLEGAVSSSAIVVNSQTIIIGDQGGDLFFLRMEEVDDVIGLVKDTPRLCGLGAGHDCVSKC